MKQNLIEEILRFNLLSKYDNSKTLSEQITGAWAKYPCVISHPNAKEVKLSDGSSTYEINGVYYYGGGRKKLADGTMANFTCNDAEFKTSGGAAFAKFPCVVNHPSAKMTKRGDGTVDYVINGVTYYGNGRKMLSDGKMANFTCNDAEFKTWKDFPCVSKHPKAKEVKLSDGSSTYEINGVYYYGGGRKKLVDGTMANFTCNDPEFKTNTAVKPVAIPTELKDVNGVKSFQDWLDINAKGWATGYKDGILNKGQNGGGYGSFGKRTQKAWTTYKDQYLKSSTTTAAAPVTTGATQTTGYEGYSSAEQTTPAVAPGPDDTIEQ